MNKFKVGDTYPGGDALDGRTIVNIGDDAGDGFFTVELANGEVWTVAEDER